MWKLSGKAAVRALTKSINSRRHLFHTNLLNSESTFQSLDSKVFSRYIVKRPFSISISSESSSKAKPFHLKDVALPDKVGKNKTDELALEVSRPTTISNRKKPLFTNAASLSKLTEEDINTYVNISEEEFSRTIGEGLPLGLLKEYEETKGSALLVRSSFIEIRNHLKAYVENGNVTNSQRKLRKQFILDGPISSGKSIILAMLAHWARSEGWFVFYVPKASMWTHGGVHFKNPVAPSWDTPVQAETVLGTLLKSHEQLLQRLPCRIFEPIILGEAPDVGMMKDAEAVAMPEGCTLFDLVQTGIACPHAAVGVVVRLREELSLVKEVPVLFAIDQYNSWFTFSQYIEHKSRLSKRSIHARELTMVKPYRTMLHNDMMVTAYSHSTKVGKLRLHLPDTPEGVRYEIPRYSISEAEAVADYYHRQSLIPQGRFDENQWKRVFYLTNGNGREMRHLLRYL
eukprot:TRINITY_DN27358_c0_g1_i1.p1 TRINITY_DN27358_c0_g1~~TRINITY_DN27358_c0_g1_i1.p1  ORF type:complete len:457 (-),score=57.04 TRINITY_DN27358_c0_g1_i1:509-1879(-)